MAEQDKGQKERQDGGGGNLLQKGATHPAAQGGTEVDLVAQQESLMEFPCAFPIKVMGGTHPDFASSVLAIMARHDPGFSPDGVETRTSSGGKYTSLTCTVTAVSRLMLDDLYRELTAHPLVKVVF